MTSKSFVIAALAVGCLLLHLSAAAVVTSSPAPPPAPASSVNFTDQQWMQILAEAQGGNTTTLTFVVDDMMHLAVNAIELAEDSIEHVLETALFNMETQFETAKGDMHLLLVNANRTTLTLDQVKQVVQANLGPVKDKADSQNSTLTKLVGDFATV